VKPQQGYASALQVKSHCKWNKAVLLD
jgi:hypothetical protein